MAAGTSCLCILIVMITFAANFPQTSEALTCYCDDCDSSSLCVEPENGGACYSKVSLMDGEIQRQHRCYDPTTAQQLCNLPKSDIFVVECCYNDYCNLNLKPSLATSNSTTTTTTTSPTIHIDDPLNPEPNEHDKEDKPDEIVIKPSLDCYRLNSKRTSLVTQCTANYFGSCYHLTRKSATGDILYEVYGCADNCVEENRNRAVRTCCNTTLCNVVKDDPNNPSPPSTVTKLSQVVSPTPVHSVLSVTASIELVSSLPVLVSQEGQSWITEVYTTSTSVLSTISNPSTKSRSYPASIETTISTSELTSTATTTATTTVLSSTSLNSTPLSLQSSDNSSFSSLMYILASVFLGIIYVIAMTVVVMLTAVVCVAQKRRKSEAENKTIKRSTDTLMSVSV